MYHIAVDNRMKQNVMDGMVLRGMCNASDCACTLLMKGQKRSLHIKEMGGRKL